MANRDRIFLAHAAEDKPKVRDLYDRLKARGLEPWLDEIDLIPGQIWREEIPKAINSAAVFLACLSKTAVAKQGYLHREFRYALSAFAELPQGSIFLIPVRLDDCEVPDLSIPELALNLGDLHWVDLFAADGFEKLVAAIEFATEIRSLRDQDAGIRFQLDEQGQVDSAPDPNSDTDLDQASMQTLQEELVTACDQFIGCFDEGFGQNAFGYLINHAKRYREIVSAPLEGIQFNLAYLHGMRLQKAKDAASRPDVERLNPSLEDDQQAALDTLLSFHGLFVLSSKTGQDLQAKANAYQATRDDIQKLGDVARELKEAVVETEGFVTDRVKEIIKHATSQVGKGRFPEREAVVAETTIGNFLSVIGKASLFTAAAATGGIIENAVVDSLLGKDLVGLGVNAINAAGASAKEFLLQHQSMLKALAAASSDSLAWLPHFIDWIKSRLRVGANDKATLIPEKNSSSQPKYFEVIRDIEAPWCPQMVLLPAGKFMMGSPETEEEWFENEGPQHEVLIRNPFALGRFPVTWSEYDYFCSETGRNLPSMRDRYQTEEPACDVTYSDAEAYCAWLSEVTGRSYRLPTEAQWEYACRAGTTTPFSFGSESILDEETLRGPNQWGLHAMHLNFGEWCNGWYYDNYEGAPNDESVWLGPSSGMRIIRGGGDRFDDGACIGSANRDSNFDSHKDGNVGFRCARI